MIQIIDKVQCCGCNACGDICPKDAITFKTDMEGFWYPEVNKNKCIDCGLCEKVCPIINIKDLKKNDFTQPECWALQHKNLESLFNSTSGSAFAALAERIYKEGGYVGGAIYNDDFSVKQFISSDKKELEILRNSKYVQSDSQGFYRTVKEILQKGNKVLVCGLPCQMAALRAYLRKDYENLIIIDLVCRGINSPKILKGYIDYLEKRFDSKIVYFKTKNKELGWRKLTTKVVFENGKVLYDTCDQNYFTVGYLQTGVYCRPSCYSCQFKGYPRIADITIADLWGAERIVGKDLDNDLGTSLVMLNSQKGKEYFEEVKEKVKTKSIPFEAATIGNPALTKSLNPPLVNRDDFYKDLEALPFEDVAKKYIKLPSERPFTIRTKIKNGLSFVRDLAKCCRWSLPAYAKNIYYNLFNTQVKTNILNRKYLIINKHCVLDIAKNATLEVGGIFHFGSKRVRSSKLESRLLIDSYGTLKTTGNIVISYGADIEVFSHAQLELGAGFIANINATIICGDKIIFEDNVCLGRDVTIRDNSGEHFISRRTYKKSRPVVIGQHSWLCEGCIIMPGTKLGTGVIVGARSFVSGKFKNFTMISGYPAEIVDEDIYFKM